MATTTEGNRFQAAGQARSLPPELRCYATTRADRNCQRRTRVRRRRAACIVFDLSRAKLKKGLPLEKVLDENAPGSNTIQDEYQRRYGERPSRHTITEDLEAIFGPPTGKLAMTFSRRAEAHVQANTYSLRHVHRSLGSYGSKLMNALCNFAYALETCRSRRLPARDGSVSPISVSGAVRIALDRAVRGNRHVTGLKLAWYLAKLGVPEQDAVVAVRDYWAEVRAIGERGGRRIAWSEARRWVESAYRKLT